MMLPCLVLHQLYPTVVNELILIVFHLRHQMLLLCFLLLMLRMLFVQYYMQRPMKIAQKFSVKLSLFLQMGRLPNSLRLVLLLI